MSKLFQHIENGVLFEYDTVEELAILMFNEFYGKEGFNNPYDPVHLEYDLFNETIWNIISVRNM